MGAYIGHPTATEASVDVDVGFRDLFTQPTGGQQVLQQGSFSITSTTAPGEDHGPCLHHAWQVWHQSQHFGPSREKLGRDGDGKEVPAPGYTHGCPETTIGAGGEAWSMGKDPRMQSRWGKHYSSVSFSTGANGRRKSKRRSRRTKWGRRKRGRRRRKEKKQDQAQD